MHTPTLNRKAQAHAERGCPAIVKDDFTRE